ncbi:50S ribosomal protein L16 [Candidatus Woesearchaeota archaeon]|nr:50S ribosomal protein L16 [Candidatus Woesearchaeota archaeon]
MARIRKFCAYRRLERPYTRKSKYREKSYVRASPVCKVVRFHMGNLQKKFPFSLRLISKSSLQIRDNAIESARQISNKALEKKLGKTGFQMIIKVYPHHILRENPLAAGAGADRMSTGMAHSFGKAIGIAARVKKGQTLIHVFVEKDHVPVAKQALKLAGSKLPCSTSIVIDKA